MIGMKKYGQLDNKNGMFGKKHSKKSKEKISLKSFDESHRLFGKSGEEHPNFGRIHTEEAKNKISISSKGRKHTDESKGKIIQCQVRNIQKNPKER
jgi:hypothetical protein